MKIEPIQMTQKFPDRMLGLLFNGATYPVTRKSVAELLSHHPDLLDAETYAVRSVVPYDDFRTFIDSLRAHTKAFVKKGNARSLLLLGTEFFVSELVAEAATFPLSRISDSPGKYEFPITEKWEEYWNGIIRSLTELYGGNVHEKKIVTITSKSVFDDPKYPLQLAISGLSCVADYGTATSFHSKNEPGQWICWDFHERRVCLTLYRIDGRDLSNWVVEGSVDGETWTEIDRKKENKLLTGPNLAMGSFPVSKAGEYRFIRLTQTGKNLIGGDQLYLHFVEFFGTLTQ